MIIVKSISDSYNWYVYHASLTNQQNLTLDTTNLLEIQVLSIGTPQQQHLQYFLLVHISGLMGQAKHM